MPVRRKIGTCTCKKVDMTRFSTRELVLRENNVSTEYVQADNAT